MGKQGAGAVPGSGGSNGGMRAFGRPMGSRMQRRNTYVDEPTPTQTPETGGPTSWDFSPPHPTLNGGIQSPRMPILRAPLPQNDMLEIPKPETGGVNTFNEAAPSMLPPGVTNQAAPSMLPPGKTMPSGFGGPDVNGQGNGPKSPEGLAAGTPWDGGDPRAGTGTGNAGGYGANPRASPDGLTPGTPWNGGPPVGPTPSGNSMPETGGANFLNEAGPSRLPGGTPEMSAPYTQSANPREGYAKKLAAALNPGTREAGAPIDPRMMFSQPQRSSRFQSPNGMPGLGSFVRRNVGQWNPGTGDPRPGPGGNPNSPPARGNPDYRGGPYVPPSGLPPDLPRPPARGPMRPAPPGPSVPGGGDAPARGGPTPGAPPNRNQSLTLPASASPKVAYAPQNLREWDGVSDIDDLMGDGSLGFTYDPTKMRGAGAGAMPSIFNAAYINPTGADRTRVGGGMYLTDAQGNRVAEGQGIAGGSQIDQANLTPGQRYFLNYSGITRPTRIRRMGG